MKSSPRLTSVLVLVLAFALCGGPETLAAQQDSQPQQNTPATATQRPQQDQAAPSQTQNTTGSTPSSATPDPTRGPLQPQQQTNLPNAPSATATGQTTGTSTTNNTQQQTPEAPVGVAAAPGAPAAGGAASRPAGTAIAPAKQRQMRSILIKVGAIAAVGVAVGTIYALSRSAPSTPPGSAASTTTAAAHAGRP